MMFLGCVRDTRFTLHRRSVRVDFCRQRPKIVNNKDIEITIARITPCILFASKSSSQKNSHHSRAHGQSLVVVLINYTFRYLDSNEIKQTKNRWYRMGSSNPHLHINISNDKWLDQRAHVQKIRLSVGVFISFRLCCNRIFGNSLPVTMTIRFLRIYFGGSDYVWSISISFRLRVCGLATLNSIHTLNTVILAK